MGVGGCNITESSRRGAVFLREKLQKCQKLPQASDGESGKHVSVHVCDSKCQGCSVFVSRL